MIKRWLDKVLEFNFVWLFDLCAASSLSSLTSVIFKIDSCIVSSFMI